MKTEKELNSKILNITMTIKEQHPELSKYIEEMPVTIPDETNPAITINNLSAYYDSLNSLLNKYLMRHSNSKIYECIRPAILILRSGSL
jgi:hypothetical protein